MDALLIATGFTGALTLVYLIRRVLALVRAPLSVTAHFSPGGGCTDAIVREIAAAKREILVLAYGFTSRPIAQALVDAKFRGVAVEVILDHSNEKDPHSDLHFLLEQKLAPLIDAHHAIAHNKVMLIDGKTILTGSFNFTQHAESHNAENLMILRGCPDLASEYRHDFNHHKAHARAVETGAEQPAASPPEHHAHAGKEHQPAPPQAKSHHEDVLAAVAQGVTAPEAKEEEDAEAPIAPVTTLAAAELFARLRKEAGANKAA
jgi:phosphatidylserine/phosphatidylglycerophosphate/cardiolipin synthase-like enzyme